MTELNNESMNTVVETFLVEETVELIYDNEKLDKWNNLVGELGLTGQTKISQKDKSPIPFMHMKTGVVNIFDVLCPRHVRVNNFDITPIPVEILDLVALSKREGYFHEIEIWYDEKQPDPACVGVVYTNWYVEADGKTIKQELTKTAAEELAKQHESSKVGNYSWYMERYLLGKWGDVKRPMSELKEIARTRFVEEDKTRILTEIKKYERELEDLELLATQKFN
jgi:hypothetical protein